MIVRLPLALLALCGTLVSANTNRRALSTLSTAELHSLAALKDLGASVDTSNPNSHLSRILIPRAPDTENNTKVREYIAGTLRTLGWTIELDQFTDKTPYGDKNFVNVIATKDPKAARRIILAAHFDSKYFPNPPNNQFLGATDSAAPCAMMLDLAEALNPLLDRRAELQDEDEDADPEDDVTLQLVFFDGEEALKDWTGTDNTYGARHLAQRWQTTYIDSRQKRRMHPTATELSTINQLVLLDLLGASSPSIRSYFAATAWLFDGMASAEKRVLEAGLLNADGNGGPSTYTAKDAFFRERNGREYSGGIEDDHIPFLRRGVEILHVIASPFPHVWHSIKDDASALDLPTMRRWNLILRVFFSEYFGLKPDTGTTTPTPTPRVGRADEDL